MASNALDLDYRTRIHKISGVWRVDYYLPYSGHLYATCDTWDEALIEANHIEVTRNWG